MASVPGAELETLRLRLEVVSLRGLAEAAEALLGECPAAVCEVLASWNLARSGELPRLVDQCWAALAPLGVGRPAGPAPGALEELLAGQHAEAQVAIDALEDCRDCADRVPAYPARSPASGVLDGELWRQALVSALDDFWSLTTDICARAHLVLLRGERTETARFLEFERAGLGEVAERIEALANCVASPGLAPPSSDSSPEQTSALPARPFLIDLRVQTPAEEIRRWLPVVFLVAVTGLAVVVLVMVAYGSPPG